MFSISQLRRHLFPIFKLMKDTGIVMDVVYDNTVYELTVRKTTKKPKRSRPKHYYKQGATVQALPVTNCEKCGSLMFAGVCMDTKCDAT